MAQEGKESQQFPHLDGSAYADGKLPGDQRRFTEAAQEYQSEPGVDPQAPDLTTDDSPDPDDADDAPRRTRTRNR
jgi:hypothetical protein